MLTEYGLTAPNFFGTGSMDDDSKYDEAYQSRILQNYWCDIENHTAGKRSPNNSIGGFDYEWLDSWWQNGDSFHVFVDTTSDLEVSGKAGQGSGAHSPYERQIRASYGMYQDIWTRPMGSPDNCTCL